MDDKWRRVLEELIVAFDFEFVAAMNVASREVITLGDTPSLHDKGLAVTLTGDAEAWDNLYCSMSGSESPRHWGQGEYAAHCFNHEDQVIVVAVGKKANDVFNDYSQMKAVHQKLVQLVGGATAHPPT